MKAKKIIGIVDNIDIPFWQKILDAEASAIRRKCKTLRKIAEKYISQKEKEYTISTGSYLKQIKPTIDHDRSETGLP